MLLVSGFGLGCLAVMFLVFLRDFRHLAIGRVFLLTLVAVACMLIRPAVAPEWRWLLSDVMTAVPALFWLLCQLAFSHRPRLFSIWGGLALYSFIAPAIFRAIEPTSSILQEILWQWIGWELPRICEYLLTLHGLWIIVSNWSDDLIESRRRLRGIVLGGVGVITLVITVTMNLGWGHIISTPIIASLACLLTASFVLSGNAAVLMGATPSSQSLTTKPQRLMPSDDSAQPTHSTDTVVATMETPIAEDHNALEEPNDPQLDEYEKRLLSLMDQGFYRQEKLTLKMLAQALSLPEYRTRELVNKKLGYRNFNDYINQLRISDACESLLADLETPVLNISLDVGYRSLSSFNRAFKDIMSCSPTEFRQQAGGLIEQTQG